MEFERARFELKTQNRIREKKPEISGGIKKELQKLIDAGFERLKHLRETEEGRKNESVILKLAEELNIDRKELTEEFEKGLRFNIKAGYKTKLIDRQSRNEDIDTIVGAYTLNFRQTLNWFRREKEEDRVETPKNILKIAKRMYLLPPKVIENLRDKYKDNPEVSEWIIKYFVFHNPKDPEKAIKNALKQIEDLRNEYKDNPDVDEGMIKHFVVYYPKNSEEAIENTLKQIERLKLKFPKIDEWIIKRFAVYYPKNSEEAIKNTIKQIERLKLKFPEIDEWIIKRFAVHNPRNAEKAIENIKEGKKEEVLEQIKKFRDDK